MKIWILTSEFKPEFGGGIATYVESVSKLFSDNGNDVTVFVPSKIKNIEERINSNLRIVRFLPSVNDETAFNYNVKLAYRFSEVVIDEIEKNGAPDIIESQDYLAISYYVLQHKLTGNKLLENVPVVIHLHTPVFELFPVNQSPEFKLYNYWIGQMEKFCILGASGVICPSAFLKEKVLKKIDCIIDIENIAYPYLNSVNESSDQSMDAVDVDLLYCGRLEYRKGVVQLLNGMKNIWDDGISVKLTMIGGDTFFEPKGCLLGKFLKDKYAKYVQSGNLIFIDKMPPDDLFRYIKKARLVIIPSIYENFPYVGIDSMKIGAPMMVSVSGGQSEMVGSDEQNGFIFDWNIDGDFETKLKKILKIEDNKLKLIGLNGKKRITEICNPELILKSRINNFNKIINQEKIKSIHIFPSVTTKFLKSSDCNANIESDDEIGMLSIIIPFYNLGEYLLETLESALDSDYVNKEILIINDGSNDKKSLEVLQEIEARKIKNVFIINIANGGLSNARNIGAKRARGEFIAYLDADDKIDDKFYSRSVYILNRYENVSFVYSWVKYFEGSEMMWPTFNTELPYLLLSNMLAAFVVLRKRDFIKYGINSSSMEYGLEDWDSWIKMVSHGCIGVSIPEALSLYRVRRGSMIRSVSQSGKLFMFEKMINMNMEIYKEYAVEITGLLFANHGFFHDNPGASISAFVAVDSVNNKLFKNNIPQLFNKVKFLFYYYDTIFPLSSKRRKFFNKIIIYVYNLIK